MARRKSTRAKRPRQSWGSHTKTYRDRVAHDALMKYGLSRRQVREMFNRGTFKPATRTRSAVLPKRAKRIGQKKYSRIADEELGRELAHYQTEEDAREDPRMNGHWYIDDKGKFVNSYWYHRNDRSHNV